MSIDLFRFMHDTLHNLITHLHCARELTKAGGEVLSFVADSKAGKRGLLDMLIFLTCFDVALFLCQRVTCICQWLAQEWVLSKC